MMDSLKKRQNVMQGSQLARYENQGLKSTSNLRSEKRGKEEWDWGIENTVAGAKLLQGRRLQDSSNHQTASAAKLKGTEGGRHLGEARDLRIDPLVNFSSIFTPGVQTPSGNGQLPFGQPGAHGDKLGSHQKSFRFDSNLANANDGPGHSHRSMRRSAKYSNPLAAGSEAAHHNQTIGGTAIMATSSMAESKEEMLMILLEKFKGKHGEKDAFKDTFYDIESLNEIVNSKNYFKLSLHLLKHVLHTSNTRVKAAPVKKR